MHLSAIRAINYPRKRFQQVIESLLRSMTPDSKDIGPRVNIGIPFKIAAADPIRHSTPAFTKRAAIEQCAFRKSVLRTARNHISLRQCLAHQTLGEAARLENTAGVHCKFALKRGD